jgi:hypothetical protein
MHVADELVMVTPRGALSLKHADDESGEVLPLVGVIYKVAPERWVVLGWSSYGEGMQTEHAWLVDGAAAPRVIDKLEWTTDRAHAGFAVDAFTGNRLRIGIPLPLRSESAGDDDDASLHNELDWRFVHGKQTLTLAQLGKLKTSETHVMALRAFYTPPFDESPSERKWSGRFVWFTAAKQFVR